METILICGKNHDVVEFFEHHILVQDTETGVLFLIEYHNLGSPPVVKYEKSNIISMKGWEKWPEKRNRKKKRLSVV